jgi:hypothetical protein
VNLWPLEHDKDRMTAKEIAEADMTRSNETLKSLKLFAGLAAMAMVLLGCGSVPFQKPAPIQTEYIDVDYRRFVSGLYVNELKNKYVKMDCAFASIMPGTLPSGYSSNNYMSFFVTGPAGLGPEAPGMLTVVAPKGFADVVFSLRRGDRIEIRGKAIETITRRTTGSVFRSLILQADGIEKKQAVEKSGPLIY